MSSTSNKSDLPEVYLTQSDYDRLSSLLDNIDPNSTAADGLSEELSRAKILELDLLPENIVRMNSKVRFRNENDSKVYQKTLVYPHEVLESPDNISILTPAGTALLGLHVGDSIEWALADKRKMKILLLEVTQAEIK